VRISKITLSTNTRKACKKIKGREKLMLDSMTVVRFRHPDFLCCCDRCRFENYILYLPLRPAFSARSAILTGYAELDRDSGFLELGATGPVIP
jgi:hypothetical protein